MSTEAPETPVARRFAAALEGVDERRTRVPYATYLRAFLQAEPSFATSPEQRPRLADAIAELADAGVIAPSRALETSQEPPLPRFLVLLDRTSDSPVAAEASRYPWRPELAWAARLPLRASEFEALRAIQAFLRDRGVSAPVVPMAERSLELFGSEKRLDALARNRRLFRPGRLSLDALRVRECAPPFVWRRVGSGPVVLVLENVATYHSIIATLPPDSPVGLVVFGAGGNFAASVAYLRELPGEAEIAQPLTSIRYFGDLDRRGLEIPITADVTAREAGLPSVRPAIGLWARLLAVGRSQPQPEVPRDVAERLCSWLPWSLSARAATVLAGGSRLAQEAVGTDLLSRDKSWAYWAALGPPGCESIGRPRGDLHRPRAAHSRPTSTGVDALSVADDETMRLPNTSSEWAEWVPASRTRNFVRGDPILDWLHLFGRNAAFVRDDERPGYDPRCDFRRFVLERGVAFEGRVLRLLGERTEIVRIATDPADARSFDKARRTVDAMRAGVKAVAQGVLRNPERSTFGVADLLIRSDVIAEWFPELISADEAAMPAPGLGHDGFHYRPIDVKFHTFDLLQDGHVGLSAGQLAYAVQVWLYADALGRIQGYTPSASYLLGRSWTCGDDRGDGCFERLARVDHDRWLPNREATIEYVAREAIKWVRRLHADGASWSALPIPTVPELYPHARNTEDAPWHAAKAEIADSLRELTLLPRMNPHRRAAAHALGLRRWDDDGVSATALGITAEEGAAQCDVVLAANRSPHPVVIPSRVERVRDWRTPATVEFYVDLETVSNLGDDLIGLPAVGGQALVFQIGCGQLTSDGSWRFEQWTADRLDRASEGTVLSAWLAHLVHVCRTANASLSESRILHWSPAEPVSVETTYDAARRRHPELPWPDSLPWFDVLNELVRREPIGVTGAFSFGLKPIAKAMKQAGLIETTWESGPTDGLGAMIGAFWCDAEAARHNTAMSTIPLMAEIGRYNEIDCRAMAEVIRWLRLNR